MKYFIGTVSVEPNGFEGLRAAQEAHCLCQVVDREDVNTGDNAGGSYEVITSTHKIENVANYATATVFTQSWSTAGVGLATIGLAVAAMILGSLIFPDRQKEIA